MAYAAKTKWIQCPSAIVALKDVTNTLTYTVPTIRFEYEVTVGNDVVKVLDGRSAVANILAGTATGQWRITQGMIPGVTTAAWFNNAFTLEEADNTAGYYTLTVYRHPADAAPLNFAFCKFGTFSLNARWDMQGRNEAVVVIVSGMSADPLDGTPLSLPSVGPLGALLSYATAAHTGATQVAEVGIQLTRNLVPIPEVDNTGTNANLPYLCGGLKQGMLEGSVMLRQSGIAQTVPGLNNAEAAYTVAFGAASAGTSFTMNMEFVRNAGNVDTGFTFQQNGYKLVSSDGTNVGMIVAADL